MNMFVIRTTLSGEGQAENIARAIVSGHFSPCVHLHPVRYVYRWMGSIHTEREVLLEIKVENDMLDKALKELRRLHTYELPVIEWCEFGATDETERWIKSESARGPVN